MVMLKHLITLILSGCYLLSFAQWDKFPGPAQSNFADIKFLSENEILVCGSDSIDFIGTGFIFRSSDAGQTWDTVHLQMTNAANSRVHRIHVVDEQNVYAANTTIGVLTSSDGGENWTPYPLNDFGVSTSTEAIHFINPDVGFVGDYEGDIYKTTDGGLNWIKVFEDQIGAISPVYDIDCANETECFARAAASHILLQSQDSGDSWTLVDGAPPTYLDGGMHVLNSDTIVMVTGESIILRTINGGNSWDTIPSPVPADYSDVHFVNNIGFAVGRNETIISSTDYGATWTLVQQDPESYEAITSVDMLNENQAIACTSFGNIFTWNLSTSLEEPEDENGDFEIYPNPFENEFYIRSNEYQIKDVKIFDVSGRMLIGYVFSKGENKMCCNENISNGIYFIRIETDGGVFLRKVIK